MKMKNTRKNRKQNDFRAIIFILVIGLVSGICTWFVSKTFTNPTSEAETYSCDVSVVGGPSNNGIKLSADKKSVSTTLNVTGTNRACNRYATLAVWKSDTKTGLPLKDQTFLGSDTKKLSVGTHVLRAQLPECGYWQADLLGQRNPKSVNGDADYQYPKDILVNYKLGGKKCEPPEEPPKDVCPNLDGMQDTIPAGYIFDADGNCVITTGDVCPNIDGMQDTIPDDMVKDDNGDCVPITEDTDVCPNIDGMQNEVPEGYTRDAAGNCIIATVGRPIGSTPTPESIADTGPGTVAAIVAGAVTIGSTLLYYLYIRRKTV